MIDSALQGLSTKDRTNFRNLVVGSDSNQKLYENKKYPKGLKGAESLLKTNPKHAGKRS